MTVSKTTSKVTKPIPKPKVPKFGEVGFKFNILAEIISAKSKDFPEDYAFTIKINLESFEDYEFDGEGFIVCYEKKQDLLDLVSQTDKKILKSHKQEELKKLQAQVDALTKEIAAIK